MLATDEIDRPAAVTDNFCWSCGVTDPSGDPCGACGVSARPRWVSRSKLIGSTASIRQKLRTRAGLVVAETTSSALLAFPDASVGEAPKEKLIDVGSARNGARSSAWTLVSASRTIKPNDRRKFDELISSFVLTLIDRSVDDARAFALDALDADCPAWLDKIHLTKSERDFLFASYHAEHGNTAMALERLLRLPEDRYPTKDLVFLRCIGAIQADVTTYSEVRRQLQSLGTRPIAQALLSTISGEDLDHETWLRVASAVLRAAPENAEVTFPRALAARVVESIEAGASLPSDTWELGTAARVYQLAEASRSGGAAPQVTLADLVDAPESLVDDAIELGALTVPAAERESPHAKYVLARTDPDVLGHDDLVELNYQTELARRAFLRADRDALASLAKSQVADQLRTLDALRLGVFDMAIDGLESFEGQTRDKVASLAQSLAEGSIDHASNEVLTDGTTWPVLAPLLPEDPSALNSLSASRPALRGIAAWRALSGSVSRLWDWDWEGALVEAKRCLLVARDEHTRDEALNLIACAEWELGDDADAIAALSSALEGNYTEGLQVNIGVIAASLEPQLAGEHLGKLAVEAPTLAMKVAAAGRALELWYADPNPWDTQESDHALPTQLRDALRALVRSDIGDDSFVRFARTMSSWDEVWLGRPDQLVGSPFEGTAAAVVYQAKARDFEEFVKALAGVVAREGAPEWASDERDNLVGSALAALNPDEANPMAASFGLMLIDSGLPVAADIYIDLVAFTIVAICDGIDPAEGEPKERFIDMVIEARRRLEAVNPDRREQSTAFLDIAAQKVAGSIAAARMRQYNEVVDLYNEVVDRVGGVPSYQLNRSVVQSVTQPGVTFLTDTARIVERLIKIVPDYDHKRQLLADFAGQVRQMLSDFNRLRG